MADKKALTPKEIPLHEVVLSVMYAMNKERPAELTANDVYQGLADNTLSDNNISDVLNWLVAQKEVEYASGKYSLDRFSFLEERKKDLEKQGVNSELPKETPLHEVVLNAMFTANTNEPAKLTLDDVFWRISDPKVHKSHLGDVMNWLQNQRRVEYLSGKYSLDNIEFQDQKKAEESKVKKASKKKKSAKKKTKEAPKIVIPSAPKKEVKEPERPKTAEKTKVGKDAPEKKVEKPATSPKKKGESENKPLVKSELKKVEPKTEKPIEAPVPPKPIEPENQVQKAVEVVEKVESSQFRWRKPVFIAIITCLLITFYLINALDQSIPGEINVSNNILIGLYALNSVLIVLVTILFYRKD